MFIPFLKLVIGSVLLIWGADLLVRGASNIARHFGLSELFIGLTVVAFGTSAPELAVSILSVLQGTYDLAIGNVVGSNTANILVILGLSAIVKPLIVDKQVMKYDLPVMVVVTLTLVLFCLNGALAVWEGIFLVAAYFLYIAGAFVFAKKNKDNTVEEKVETSSKGLGADIAIVIIGLVGLVGGSQLVVSGATSLAKACGVSDLLIGLTIVAVGTSLPEIATSVVATARGKCDLAIGNVIGSNISNILFILGMSTIFSFGSLEISSQVLHRDMLAMVLATLVCIPMFFSQLVVTRIEGIILILGYAFYITICALSETNYSLMNSVIAAMYCYLGVSSFLVTWFVCKDLKKKS